MIFPVSLFLTDHECNMTFHEHERNMPWAFIPQMRLFQRNTLLAVLISLSLVPVQLSLADDDDDDSDESDDLDHLSSTPGNWSLVDIVDNLV